MSKTDKIQTLQLEQYEEIILLKTKLIEQLQCKIEIVETLSTEIKNEIYRKIYIESIKNFLISMNRIDHLFVQEILSRFNISDLNSKALIDNSFSSSSNIKRPENALDTEPVSSNISRPKNVLDTKPSSSNTETSLITSSIIETPNLSSSIIETSNSSSSANKRGFDVFMPALSSKRSNTSCDSEKSKRVRIEKYSEIERITDNKKVSCRISFRECNDHTSYTKKMLVCNLHIKNMFTLRDFEFFMSEAKNKKYFIIPKTAGYEDITSMETRTEWIIIQFIIRKNIYLKNINQKFEDGKEYNVDDILNLNFKHKVSEILPVFKLEPMFTFEQILYNREIRKT